MRKPLLLSVLIACNLIAHAQIDKGKWIAGIGIQMSRYESKGQEVSAGGAVTPSGRGTGLSLYGNGEIARQLSSKGAIGIGFSYANPTSRSYDIDGSLLDKISYPSLKTYLFYQLQKNIYHKFTYNPRIETYYQNRNNNTVRYTPGFNPVRGRTRTNLYGVELKPLNFRYFLTHRIFLEASLASLVFEYGNETDYRFDRTIRSNGTSLLINGGNVLNALIIDVVF